MGSVLGILAGGGSMPGRVAAAAAASGRPVFLIGIQGEADVHVLAPYPHAILRLGAAGRILDLLRARDCHDLVLVGAVRRPSLLHLRPDVTGLSVLARIGKAAFRGDDGLLAATIRVLGEYGFRVLAVQDVLPEALAPSGLLTQAAPDEIALADVARGRKIAVALGSADVGQGCVVQQGLVLAVEAVEGTDAMLARAAGLARPGPGGVLVKWVKPHQDRRVDLPAIGCRTVANAAAAGLRGIAFSAGGALIADREATIASADSAGLFLLGVNETD